MKHPAQSKKVEISKKHVIVVVFVTIITLSIPLIAMLFTNEVKWDLLDFAVIGALLIGAGLSYELLSTRLRSHRQKIALATLILVALLLIWIQLAVGIFGTSLSGS